MSNGEDFIPAQEEDFIPAEAAPISELPDVVKQAQEQARKRLQAIPQFTPSRKFEMDIARGMGLDPEAIAKAEAAGGQGAAWRNVGGQMLSGLGQFAGSVLKDPFNIVQPIHGMASNLERGIKERSPGQIVGALSSIAAGAEGAKKVPAGIAATGRTARAGAQRAAGAGPELTREAFKARSAEILEAQTKYQEKLGEVTAKRAEATLSNEMQAAQVARRQALEKQMEADGAVLNDNVRATEANVRTMLNSRGNALRDTLGNVHAEPKLLPEAINEARQKFVGTKGDINAFNKAIQDALEPEAGKSFMDLEGGAQPGTIVNYADLHRLQSRLGNKMASGGIPGELYKAVEHVHDAALGEMQNIAKDMGLARELADFRQGWHEFMDTFHNTSSMATGGSPVARIHRAADPGFAYAPLLSKAGKRAVMLMEKYRNFGAQPELARGIINANAERMTLPKSIKAKALPDLPKEPVLPPEVNPQALKMEQLKKASKGPKFSYFYDVVLPTIGLAGRGHYGLPAEVVALSPALRRTPSWILRSERVREMLSKPSKADIRAIRKQ